MPIEPRHLLDLARRLIGPAPGAVEADLRRGISTAYYALFHLLIKEAMTSFVTDPSFRPRVARALQHGPMKSVCEKYNPARPNGAGQFVTQQSHGIPAQIIAPDVPKSRPRLSLCTRPESTRTMMTGRLYSIRKL